MNWAGDITTIGDSPGVLPRVGLRWNSKYMITLATYQDHEEIIEVWEQSIRSTHRFLVEKHLQEIKSHLRYTLQQVKVYAYRAEDRTLKGFVGLKGHKVEMLFVRPEYFGENVARQLANFCIYSLHVDELNVKEPNDPGLEYYKNLFPISNS